VRYVNHPAVPPEDLARMLRAAQASAPTARPAAARRIVGIVLVNCLYLLIAAALFVTYQHFKLGHHTGLSIACLVGAGLFALAPVRAVLKELVELESHVLHLAHGAGGLMIAGLVGAGAIKGEPMLTHAALAPFAIMGAAQAIMHQDHPRNAKQAEALRRFATSLPEIQQFTKTGDLASPQNAARAVAVLSDLIGKAQALGETELEADPGFQSALRQATTRVGLTLSLDSLDHTISTLAKNPQAAKAVPELRRKLEAARSAVAGG
jgi:hypothetical protein